MRTCKDCLLRKQNGGETCPVFQEKVNDNDTACRKYIGHDSDKCSFCGSLMPGKAEIVIMEDGTTVLSCGNCANQLGNCATCAEVRSCDFETNPVNIPKQIPKVIRQGNMQMQTIIRNPEREKATCMKGCKCWDEENCVCRRQNGSGCGGWHYNEDK